MSTTFPTIKDSFGDYTDNVTDVIAAHPNNLQDAMEAVQEKIGIDGSGVSTSFDYLIKNTTGGHDHDGLDSKKVITTNLNVTGLTVSQLLRVNSGGTAIESSGKTVPTGDIVGLSDTQTLTNKTLTAPIIVDGGFVSDSSGNEYLKFSRVASAVNELTVKNAATTNSPELMATGETNVDLTLRPKGSGRVKIAGGYGQDIITQGTLRFYDLDDSNYVALKSPAAVLSNLEFSLPSADGSTGQVMITNGSQALSFGTIGNAAIASNAAISLSKLASGTSGNVIVANVSGVPTYVAMSGDVTINNAGVTAVGNSKITSAMVDSVYTSAIGIGGSTSAGSGGSWTTIEGASVVVTVSVTSTIILSGQLNVQNNSGASNVSIRAYISADAKASDSNGYQYVPGGVRVGSNGVLVLTGVTAGTKTIVLQFNSSETSTFAYNTSAVLKVISVQSEA